MTRRITLAVLAGLLAATTAGRATPKDPPPVSTAGALMSPNVSLLYTLPDTGSVGGRFVDHYYFTTTFTGLRIYDVSNPELPVLAGALALPHFENEDVDVSKSRKLLMISNDNTTSGLAGIGMLYVISWANPMLPQIVGTLQYPEFVTLADGSKVGGPGHIANCIADCARDAYITGARDGSIFVIDLKDPAHPSIAKTISPKITHAGVPNAVFKTGVIHNVDIDEYGHAWLTGSGGTSELDVSNPLRPRALRWTAPADNKATDHFIHHNSLRLDRKTVLVTEEDYVDMCGKYPQAPNPLVPQHEGTFQTWRITSRTGAGALKPLDQWHTELGNYLDGYQAATATCSSHWFTFNSHKIAAVGWYNQGVRFLDVSNPKHIRQVGYYLPPSIGLGTSEAVFMPGHDDIVYVPDYGNGMAVLKILDGGAGAPTVRAPVRSEWLAPKGLSNALRFADPDPVWGWACLHPRGYDLIDR